MSDIDKKKQIEHLFKGYRTMNRRMQRELSSLGIDVVKRRKHWILKVDEKVFSCSSSGSDWRGGLNLAHEIMHSL